MCFVINLYLIFLISVTSIDIISEIYGRGLNMALNISIVV
jgi:hypothetical protein